jgi:hypothetical protein
VAQRLGHSSAAITHAIYEHCMPADNQAAALVWNNAMKTVLEASRQEHARKRRLPRVITGRAKKKVIPIKSAS